MPDGFFRGSELAVKRKKVSLPVKIAVIAFALYAAVTLLSLQTRIKGQRESNEALADRLSQQEETNAKLEEDLSSELSDEDLMDMARERLGLVLPGERVFVGVSN